MAITMDHFTAQNKLKQKDVINLELQKKNLQVHLEMNETKHFEEEKVGDLSANKYSADEFESDDSQQIFNKEEVKEEVR